MWEFIIVYINFIHFYKNQYEKKGTKQISTCSGLPITFKFYPIKSNRINVAICLEIQITSYIMQNTVVIIFSRWYVWIVYLNQLFIQIFAVSFFNDFFLKIRCFL